MMPVANLPWGASCSLGANSRYFQFYSCNRECQIFLFFGFSPWEIVPWVATYPTLASVVIVLDSKTSAVEGVVVLILKDLSFYGENVRS